MGKGTAFGKTILIGDQFVILSVEKHSPSFAQGLQSGDRIVAIEGIPTEGLRYGELIHKLNGPPNTNVQLLIKRSGHQSYSISIVMPCVYVYSVSF